MIRIGFVSNSSSCSFTIKKNKLGSLQLWLLLKYDDLPEELRYYGGDSWHIGVEKDAITGWTVMDNGYMEDFLCALGVKSKHIKWDRG